MKGKVKAIVVLSLICFVSALLLGIVNHITAPKIKQNLEEKEKKSLSMILKEGEVGTKLLVEDFPGVSYKYPVLDNDGNVTGMVLILTGEGYGGTINLISLYNMDGSLKDARVTNHSESPGIGSKSTEPGYMDMFIGKGGETPLPKVRTDLPQVQADAISGASVTFEAVSRALQSGSAYVKEKGDQ